MKRENAGPNLVFVFPDQFRQQALGFMGQDPVVTPNFDRFASESLVFTHAVSNYPVCSPYRGMLFSGKYPFSNGVYGNCYSRTIADGIELREDERCFSDVLHDAGYDLGYIGKWHLDLPKEEHIPFTEGYRCDGSFWDAYTPPGPRRHGFNFWHAYGCCDSHLEPHYWENDAKVDERIDVKTWSVEHETDVAIRYIRNQDGSQRDPDKPFALFVAHNPPHTPFEQVPERYLKVYEDKTVDELLTRPNVKLAGGGAQAARVAKQYFAAVTGIDEQFGRLLAALDEEGLRDDTIVVFTADHGEMMGSHGRMHKNVWYDESFLIPFIIRWPGHITPGRDDLLLGVPDVMPSLLALMGYEKAIPDDVEGMDYSPIFRGGTAVRPDSAFYLVAPAGDMKERYRGIRTHDYTFVVMREPGGESLVLHDNNRDPYQLENIAEKEPDLARSMRKKLQRWFEYTNDPWLTGVPADQR